MLDMPNELTALLLQQEVAAQRAFAT